MQLLITRYKEHENEEAELESNVNNRFNLEHRQYESQIEDLEQRTENLHLLLAEEKKKYEGMLRERNMSNAAATEGEVTVRDAIIAKLKEQHERVTADSIKKSTKIEELKGQHWVEKQGGRGRGHSGGERLQDQDLESSHRHPQRRDQRIRREPDPNSRGTRAGSRGARTTTASLQ